MGAAKLTAADGEQIALLAAGGASDPEIAAKLGYKVTTTAIYIHRKRNEIPAGRVKPPNAVERGEHGSVGAYDLGCRCEICRKANNARVAAIRAALEARIGPATRLGEPWEPWEDEILMAPRPRGSMADLCTFLGRSYQGVVQRQRRVRQLADEDLARKTGNGTLW